MRQRFYAFLAVLVVSLAILGSGCAKKGTESQIDKDAAREKVKVANSALETELYALISTELSGVERPADLDFSVSNSLYKDALVLDPENLDANFGAGLTEFLIVTLDSSVNAVFDEWDTYLDTASLFTPKSAIYPGKKFAKGIVNPGLPTGEKDFELPSNFLLTSIFSVFYTGLTNPPQIHDVQDLIDNEVLPRADYALGHLKKAASNRNYSFIITPKMQGDLDEDPLELDLTEIYLIITGLDLLKSFGNIATTYNFDFPSYDSLGLIQVLPQNSSFLSLRPAGASKLAAAKSAFLDAADNLEDAINFLRSETDDQNNDIIKIDPTQVADEDLDSILAYIPRVRNTLLSSENVTADFDGDGTDETVAFAAGAFFDNPIGNLKQDLLPGYTARVERDSSGWWYPDYFWVAIIVWNADSFDQWIFPNPTFNGILPGMTSDLLFKQTFGIDASDWKKEVRLDIFRGF